MKEIFFKGVAVALPLVVLGGLVYLIFRGFYELYSDIQLKRELEQIRRESAERRRHKGHQQEEQTDSVQHSDQTHIQ